MFGFLNVYKPKGKTSHDIVAILRKITKIKQIGHTGTLDPFAEGVLPLCIGKATRLIEYLSDDKAYIGTIQLGSSTSTYDIEGDIVNRSEKNVSLSDIEKILKNFKGEIEQLPPIYSAIKVNGKKLYEYARAGETVEIKPRKINISKLEILNFSPETRQLELIIECSKGTYIRTIANDIGEALGTYGHLIKLVRIKAGDFLIDSAVDVNELKTKDDVIKKMLSPMSMLHYDKYELSAEEYKKVLNGANIENSKNINSKIILLTKEDKLIATGELQNRGIIKCLKVFAEV